MDLDFLAFGLALFCTLLLILGTRESAGFNTGETIMIWMASSLHCVHHVVCNTAGVTPAAGL